MKTLQQIQQEIGKWAQKQFGVNTAKAESHHERQVLNQIPSLYGVLTELGELAAIDVREMQGRSKLKTSEERQAAREDAVADLMVFLCDYCFRMDIDLNEALDKVWTTVQKRSQATWEQDKAKESKPNFERAGFGAGCTEGNHEWLWHADPTGAYWQCQECGAQTKEIQ